MGEQLRALLNFLRATISNEIGAAGDEEEFSDEEKAILGEKDEEEVSEKEGEKDEKGEEEAEEEKEEEEEKEVEEEKETKGPIPYERFKEKLDRANEADELETKLDLLRTNPEEYYKTYPEEKGEEEAEEDKLTPSFKDAAGLVVKGGDYDGKTLAEVHAEDPFAAMDFYYNYRDGLREEERKRTDSESKLLADSETEVNAFSTSMAKEMFEVDDLGKLDEEQGKKISGIIDSVIKWMGETGRGGAKLEDAYFLMHKDKILNDAKGKGIAGLIKSTQDHVSSIDSKKDTGGKSGYEADIHLTADQLADKLEAMSEAESMKYLEKAPQKLRDKFPSVAWG